MSDVLPALLGPAQRPVVIAARGVLGAGALAAQAAALAERLPPDARHVINLSRGRAAFLVTLLAALQRGCTTLLPQNRQIEALAALRTAYPDAVFCGDGAASERDGLPLDLEVSVEWTVHDTTGSPSVPARQPAVIAFTSGSTGAPRPNAKSWATLWHTGAKLAARLPVAGCRLVGTVPVQHMYGLESLVMPALRGEAALVEDQPFLPAEVWGILDRLDPPRALVTTPVHLRSLAGAVPDTPPRAAFVLSATAPLATDLAARIEAALGAPVFEIYGFTEAGSVATRRTVTDGAWRLLPGFAFEDTGEALRADHLPEAVAFPDLIRRLDAEHFVLQGRKGDLLNVGGKRSSLSALTQQLLDIEGVEDAVVFLPGDAGAGPVERPAAVVVTALDPAELRRRLAQRIDPVFIPRPLRIVTEIPRAEHGKVGRATLERLLREGDPA